MDIMDFLMHLEKENGDLYCHPTKLNQGSCKLVCMCIYSIGGKLCRVRPGAHLQKLYGAVML